MALETKTKAFLFARQLHTVPSSSQSNNPLSLTSFNFRYSNHPPYKLSSVSLSIEIQATAIANTLFRWLTKHPSPSSPLLDPI